MNTAIFRFENEKYAAKGVVTLLPQYCDEHKYLDMDYLTKKKESLRKGIKNELRESILGDEEE
jgi:hypothetical protein